MVDTAPQTTAAIHPLDVLSADELRIVTQVVLGAGRCGERPAFAWAALAEPDKDDVLAWTEGAPFRRMAEAVLVDRATGTSYEALVDVATGTLEAVTTLDGLHAPIVIEEFLDAQAVVNDAAVWAALQRRGVTDPATVYIEPWPAVNFGEDFDGSGRRLGRCVFYVRDAAGDQPWARPVQGLVAVADRSTGEVVHLIDDGTAVPVPVDPGRFDPEAGAPLRTDLKPLHISQPEGPSFTLEGGVLRWQRWNMRLGMHPIEGLVVRQVAYDDPATGQTRPILYRGAMAEMVVPYGDPQPQHFWRHVFDEGEVGMGRSANSLTLGCDCLGEIRYLDAPIVLSDGTVATIRNAVCVHEEDFNVLWRHHDRFAERTEVRRSRRLVVSFWATLGNYDYGYYWHFYQDGSVEVEVKLSGIPLVSAVLPDAPPSPYGVRARPDIELPHHQHFFCFRLDLDVDGPGNTVEEVDLVVDAAGPANRYGNAFRTQSTTIAEEASSARRAEPLAGRVWRVSNPSVRNAVGEPVSYTLSPHVATPLLFADDGSAVAKRAAWARHHLSVTRYAPGELRASGAYPNQHPGGAGLPAYRAAGRDPVDRDVVLWVTLGSNHVSRPEDWPVMPVERTGFTLRPTGFFDRNPALDVPPQELVNPTADGHCAQPEHS